MAAYDDKSLYEYLLSLGAIDQKLLYQSFVDARQTQTPLQDILVSRDIISSDDLGQVLSELTHFPLAKLSGFDISDSVLSVFPQDFAEKYKAIAFERTDDTISVALSDPSNSALIDYIAKWLGLKVKAFIATNKDLEEALARYSKDISQVFKDQIAEKLKVSEGKTLEELPIEDVLNAIINYAYENKASDVHIEPFDDRVVVRTRIDGVLRDAAKLSKTIFGQIVNRVKFLANLRTDEHHAAQDGKFIFKTKEDLDIRVSIVPTVKGERISLRLLSEKSRQFGLNELGFDEASRAKIVRAYKKPYGMILAAGPTGSGKTTTLYAILKLLNKRGINILTIEDPVEYEIEGVSQIQVNPKTNLTFAEGLKSIARQDPDIILVGEIRDEETAGIAVNSALTGHLVLSSLHANDAATAFPRLFDFKVEPFLIASTVNLIIAQRLVRKICTGCRVSETIDSDQIRVRFSSDLVNSVFGTDPKVSVYRGKGCALCGGTGYLGRIGIFEVLEVTGEIRNAIIEKQDSPAIRDLAVINGMTTMNASGLQKVKEGITTLEEIIRTTEEQDGK